MFFPSFRTGRHVRSDIGTLCIVPRTSVHTARFAVVVSRKVAKMAVERNRIKRRIRALFTIHTVPLGFLYIFYPTSLPLRLPWKILKTSFNELIKKA